jgi:hypothetical protein
MKLEKDNLEGEIILRLKEPEYIIVLRALKSASSDDARGGDAYLHFYGADRGDVVRLLNQIDEAESKA